MILRGFYADVATREDRVLQQSVTHAVADLAVRRASIEQAKGMLMLVYGITDTAAFALLKWRSQETNTKLRALAHQVVADFRNASSGQRLPTRADYDRLLVTAHMRAAEIELPSKRTA